MRFSTCRRPFPALLLIAALCAVVITPTLAQSPPKKRPKLKDFGSSLKRLKWDPVTKSAAETNESKQSTSSSDGGDVIRIETNLVACDILVSDSEGRLVGGLTAEDFIVSEDGEPQQVEHFLRGDNSLPLSIVLIIDYSGSQFPYLRTSINAAKVMVDQLGPSDVMAIVTDDVELLADFTNDKQKLKGSLDSLVWRTKDQGLFGPGRQFGKSAQYSALMATLKEAFIQEDLRPVIVLQTDGDELEDLRESSFTPSIPPDLPDDLKKRSQDGLKKRLQYLAEHRLEFGLEDIHRAVEKSRATIYTVVSGYRVLDRPAEEQVTAMKKESEQRLDMMLSDATQKEKEVVRTSFKHWRISSPQNLAARAKDTLAMQTALASIAPRSGGLTEFLELPEQAEGIYSRIFSDITQRYIVGYYSTNKNRDGKRRRIQFAIKGHPEYQVLSRTAYYAPTP